MHISCNVSCTVYQINNSFSFTQIRLRVWAGSVTQAETKDETLRSFTRPFTFTAAASQHSFLQFSLTLSSLSHHLDIENSPPSQKLLSSLLTYFIRPPCHASFEKCLSSLWTSALWSSVCQSSRNCPRTAVILPVLSQ